MQNQNMILNTGVFRQIRNNTVCYVGVAEAWDWVFFPLAIYEGMYMPINVRIGFKTNLV